MCDIAAVNCGIKPCFLFDYGPVKPDQMLHLMHDLLQQGLLHHVSQPATFLILEVGGDVLLCNMVALRDHLSRVFNERTIAFTDISKTNKQPKLIDQLDMLNGNIAEILEDLLIFCNSDNENNYEISFPPSLNLTTLVGILLGYPVVYWFSRSNEHEGNSLEINTLLVFKVMAQIRMLRTCQSCDRSNKGTISTDCNISSSHICDKNFKDVTLNAGQETFRHAIYSFSVPENLALQVSSYVETWMDTVMVTSAWREAFQNLQLERNIVFAPAVTLWIFHGSEIKKKQILNETRNISDALNPSSGYFIVFFIFIFILLLLSLLLFTINNYNLMTGVIAYVKDKKTLDIIACFFFVIYIFILLI